MSRYVLDSFAILAFLQKEKGWERIKSLLEQAASGDVELHMSLVNMAEVHYLVMRRREDATQVLAAIEALPIRISSADEYIPRVVELKARYHVSLADCFGAALAVELRCPVITGDPEFEKMSDILTIEWIA